MEQIGEESCFSAEEESPASIQVTWHSWSRLAHVSAHSRNLARRDGRTSVDDPRLLAAQQSSCHQQISANDIEDEPFRAGEAGRGDYASGWISAAQINSRSVNGGEREKQPGRSLFTYRPLISHDREIVRTASA